ncbi:MAG: 2-dehydropantoate 2-reductase [Halieaceae bacterium]|nr:2-dehydropantoate 2-reductase [Halieaceae bacterium]
MIRRWYILGAGAIGRLFACKLQRLGLDPVMLLRSGEHGKTGITLRRDGEEEKLQVDTCGIAQLAVGEIDGLLVTTKANDAAMAVTACIPALVTAAPVVLLHNGMGVLEQLQRDHPALNLFAGTTTEGAYRDGEILVHAGLGDTVFGREQTPAPPWFAAFVEGNERFSWSQDIDEALWKKLLINCAINPLTALHRCRNGALLDNPALRAEVELLCEELAAVSAARGNARGAGCALDWALGVIQRTADNQSSMLQDALAGRDTEIRYITGYLVSEAQRLGVPVPRNEALLRQLDSTNASN